MSCFPTGPLPKRTLFTQGPLVVLTDDPPRADSTLAWKYAHGPLSDTQGMDWFADPEIDFRGPR